MPDSSASRIVVGFKADMDDARGERVRREIERHLGISLQRVRVLDVYTVDVSLDRQQLEQVAAGPFCDPVIQEYAINRPLAQEFDVLIEVGR